jgi:hypothetical protein
LRAEHQEGRAIDEQRVAAMIADDARQLGPLAASAAVAALPSSAVAQTFIPRLPWRIRRTR